MLSIQQAATFLGITPPTLRRWEQQGLICPHRTQGNHRRYTQTQLRACLLHQPYAQAAQPTFGQNYLYARVSTYKQKKNGNLARQVDRLETYHRMRYGETEPYVVIQDYGSGLNSNRRGLLRLMRDAERGKVARIFITFPDRLTRFGFLFLERYFASYHISIFVIDESPSSDLQKQLVTDMMSLIASFSGKLYALRAHRARQKAHREQQQESISSSP